MFIGHTGIFAERCTTGKVSLEYAKTNPEHQSKVCTATVERSYALDEAKGVDATLMKRQSMSSTEKRTFTMNSTLDCQVSWRSMMLAESFTLQPYLAATNGKSESSDLGVTNAK